MDTTGDKEKLFVLLAGQSNMAGRGIAEIDDLTEIPDLLVFRPGNIFRSAVEPVTRDRKFIGTFSSDGKKIESADPWDNILPENGGQVIGVGPGRTLGKMLLEMYPGKQIVLLPCAVGGTSISAWMPGGHDDWDVHNFPYDNAVKLAKEAQKYGRIIAVCWHQGESDAAKRTQDYTGKLRSVVRNFRRDLDLGEDVPFIAGDMASFYNPEIADNIDIVDDALALLAAEDTSFRYVLTKDLMHKGDHLHYDTASAHELGKRYFEAYRQFEANPDITPYADSVCGIGEGPFFSRCDKKLYWVNPDGGLEHQTPGFILRKENGSLRDISSFAPECGPVSAFSQREDGTFLLFASGGCVWYWRPEEKAELFAELAGGKFKFNDVTTTPDGHVFCTVLPRELHQGTGELWDLAPDGSFKLLDKCSGIPNGMGFSPDGKTFYFTATTEKTIYRYTYRNKQISEKEIFVSGIGCDGLAVDTQGGVWSAGWTEKIRRFFPDGHLDFELTFPDMIISSLCFGGKENRDLFITTANYPFASQKHFRNRSGNVFIWKNSPYQGLEIPFFAGIKEDK